LTLLQAEKTSVGTVADAIRQIAILFSFEQFCRFADSIIYALKTCQQTGEGGAMASLAKHEILLVDDSEAIRDCFGSMLTEAGYQVSLAENGLDALLQLRRAFPTVIISDLNMPQMSGFEFLSVVRRRFPQIPVIAMSGAYQFEDAVPGGVIADAFFAKGRGTATELLKVVASLIQTSAARALAHQKESAPVWTPRNGKDSQGIPYVVLTCTECLRSFPLSVVTEDLQRIQETQCLFCTNTVRYIIDFSLSIVSPRPEVEAVTIIRGPMRMAAVFRRQTASATKDPG
jgi:CheY-like chemotaxis protein